MALYLIYVQSYGSLKKLHFLTTFKVNLSLCIGIFFIVMLWLGNIYRETNATESGSHRKLSHLKKA